MARSFSAPRGWLRRTRRGVASGSCPSPDGIEPSTHPQHDDVACTVASWYRTAAAEQGYEIERRRFGWYRTNRDAPTWGAVTATDVDDVHEFLRDIEAFFGDRTVSIQFEREPSAREELVSAGWSDVVETVYLAHVGDFPPTVDVEVAEADSSTIEDFARAKILAFADSEEEPDRSTLDAEIAMRRAELRGDGRGVVARVGTKTAAMCAYYSGDDYFVFLLGTRVPYRRRGIASALLRHVVDEARAAGARSVVINARAGGRPEALYGSLGFSDEVYRQWSFSKPS